MHNNQERIARQEYGPGAWPCKWCRTVLEGREDAEEHFRGEHADDLRRLRADEDEE